MGEDWLLFGLRGGERLLVVLVAALCVWLGYRLFQALPTVQQSDGRVELPGAKVVLSKVGPGAFFALFGAVILVQSVLTQVTVERRPAEGGPVVRVVQGAASGGDPVALRMVQTDIEVLNCLAASAPDALGRGAVETAVHKARVAMLERVWSPQWGAAAFAALERGEVRADAPFAAIYGARRPGCGATAGGAG